MLHRSTTLAVIALVSGLLLGAPGSAATAAPETCQGRPATIVGTGPEIQGTPGDDVVVTGASEVVYTHAGNDLVCVSPAAHEDVYVFAGPGDDVVDASVSTATSVPGTVALLDTGLDRFIGGPSYDEVHANGADDDVAGADMAILEVAGLVTGPRGSYTGSHIRVLSASQDVEIDLGGQVVVAGVDVADIAGFTRASVVAPRAVVRGNDEDNLLRASGCVVHIVGKGGDDVIDGYAGEGAPRFDCESEATMRGGAGDDNVKGWLGTNVLMGDGGNDKLRGRSHADVLSGGGGRDVLAGGSGNDVLRGNGGPDTLMGHPGRDTLIGNLGRDTADGDKGIDRCFAERERRCER